MTPLRRDSDFVREETAILFVDMQKIFATPGRDPSHPEYGAAHPFHRRLAATVIPNQVRLLTAARAAGVNVLHTVIEALTQDGRDRSLDHKLSHILVPKGDPEGAIIDALTPAENEIVLPKSSSGVFNSTNIDYILRNLGVSFPDRSRHRHRPMRRHGRPRRRRPWLFRLPARDGCAAYTEERHQSALRVLGGYSWLTDTATVVGRIDAMRTKSGVMA